LRQRIAELETINTECKQAKEKLKERQERLNLAIQGTRAGLWDWNLQTGEVIYNERWAEIIGYTLDELKPISIKLLETLAHPADLEKSNALIEKHLRGETDFYECKTRLKHKEGHWVWVKDRGKIVEWSEDGKPLRITGTHVDITEQVQAETALRHEYLLSQAMTKASAALTSTLDLEQVLDRILEELNYVVPHDAANFMLLYGDSLHVVRWHGYEPSATEDVFSKTFKYSEFYGLQEMVESKQPMLIPDVRKYPGWVQVHKWLHAYAAAPIIIDDETIGFLSIDNATPNSVTEEHAQSLSIFANQAAIAIKNARLYEQTQQEIIERVQAEDELRKSTENIRITLNSIGDAVISTDVEGRVVRMNPVAEQLTGWQFSEAEGRPLFEVFNIINSQTRKTIENPATKVLMTGEVVGLGNHTALIAKDGVEYQIADSGAPIRGASDNIIGVVLVFRNVTEEYKTREALRESEHRYRSLFAQTNDAVFILDLDGKHLEANKRAADMLGYTSDELIGMYSKHVIMPTEHKHSNDMLKELLAGHKLHPYQRMFRKKDGSAIPCEVNVELVRDKDGNPMHLQSIVRDSSNRIEMEKQLRRQGQLAAVGTLASGIAHDFRNLLSTIILYAQICQRDPALPPNLEPNLKAIVGESHKATDLIHQILDFTSRSMIERQPLDLATLTTSIIALLQRTIPENVKIKFKTESKAYIVKADKGRIQQALTNLAINARDAMPNGGDLQFTLSAVTVTPGDVPPVADMPPGEWVCLIVSDTGTGMSETVQQHLFEPFFTTKDIGEGTGLGLAQVYGIVHLHEGYINVETDIGQGTTFSIYLPTYKEKVIKANEIEVEEYSPTLQGQSKIILFVEDQENLREASQHMLESLGYQVVTAANGHEALAICQSPRWAIEESNQVDLVITDLIMPEMGGVELIQELRKTAHKIKALAITGYILQEDDLKRLKKAGFVGVIHKPFKLNSLIDAIQQALE
ncbi:MAG: PAS domain S-box protein, partial [Chloroflexota bacterium]|nr:PAS domain S-box protein [Chloroflexota bacterium]